MQLSLLFQESKYRYYPSYFLLLLLIVPLCEYKPRGLAITVGMTVLSVCPHNDIMEHIVASILWGWE